MNDHRLGVARAQALLSGLHRAFTDLQGKVSARLESGRAELTQVERVTSARAEDLIHAAETGWLFRHSRVMTALDAYLQSAQAQYAAALDILVAERATAVIGDVIEEVESLQRVLAMAETRLRAEAEELAREARDEARALTPRRGDPALVLVDEAYLRDLYASYAPDLSATVATLLEELGDGSILHCCGLLGWARTDPGLITDTLRRVAHTPFEPIREMTVESVIAAREDYSPRARLAALQEEALPALNLDLARLPGGDASLRRIEVLGVPDHTQSIFRSEVSHIISTHDPHAIVSLALTVGIPYTALQAWPNYLAEYERARRLRPLHTLPTFQMQQQEHKLALALGLVFELIYTRGSYFYYKPADELAREVQLAQGGENTAKALVRQDGLVREVLERVEAHIEHIGIAQALEALDAWCIPDARDDKLARELKRLVRDHADLIRRNARLQGAR